jgi:hypothetical protein
MTIAVEISHEIEQQIRADGADLNRDAKEVYLMEQYRQARITHRQLEEALDLSFQETELSSDLRTGHEFARSQRCYGFSSTESVRNHI